MGLFDRFRKEKVVEPVTQTEKTDAERIIEAKNYFLDKCKDPQGAPTSPYENELHQKIQSLSDGDLIRIATQLQYVDVERKNRGMRALDVKETNLAVQYAEKGLNPGSFAMEADYRGMFNRINEVKWRVGEAAPDFFRMQASDAVLSGDSPAEVNVKTSHAEELSPDMMPEYLKNALDDAR